MKREMYICSKCGAVYALDGPGSCGICNSDLVNMRMTEKKWSAMSGSAREKTVSWYKQERHAPEGRDWISLLRTIGIIQVVLGCLFSIVLGITLHTLMGFGAVIVAALGCILSFCSVAVMMVFATISSDIQSARGTLEDIRDLLLSDRGEDDDDSGELEALVLGAIEHKEEDHE